MVDLVVEIGLFMGSFRTTMIFTPELRLITRDPEYESYLTFFFESKYFIYTVRNVHSRETEQHYLNIVM